MISASASQAPAAPRVVVYFGNDWSAENRTSSHHVASCLSRHMPVHYIECPGLRAPKGTGRDMRRLWAKVRLALGRGTRVHPQLTVHTLIQVPLHRFAAVRAFNRLLLRALVRRILRREGIEQPLAWFTIPHLGAVLGRIGESASVYYCIDDYASLPDVDAAAVRAMDADMTRRADVVFVASETLLASKRALNRNTHLSPHGVDVEHFARAADMTLSVPDELAGVRRPIVGFFGLIERWIDLDLVRTLAAARPHWTFVMIGRVAVPDADVPRLPNLLFLGRRPYDALPDYGRAFDAAIIPYRPTMQVQHANPLKLREYLAMGKPIVAVSTPEIEKFGDVVRIGRSAEEFLRHLDEAIANGTDADAVRARIARVAPSTWEARTEAALSIVLRHASGPSVAPARSALAATATHS